MEHLFNIQTKKGADFISPFNSPQYHVMVFKGNGTFSIDFSEYSFSGNTILFFAPYQHFQWKGDKDTPIDVLSFHGDFYCIEYHKKEVACNGLLFNNIYLYPHIQVPDLDRVEVLQLFEKMQREKETAEVFSESILKAYLQLILALCSKQKQLQIIEEKNTLNDDVVSIQQLIDTFFLQERSPSFFASALSLSPSAFTKKVKQYFGKTPTQLIQDRVVLEAKKLLHLTYKSIKEISAELNFDDEFYFSRYFKKNVGLSPAHYREKVGISIVAK
ncbi:MAG: helix-turn-helix domain-containing protein [Bacteroidia bacterium]|nr:helix-turn-helix domain-containing protein [Bacteroidia bacterium]